MEFDLGHGSRNKSLYAHQTTIDDLMRDESSSRPKKKRKEQHIDDGIKELNRLLEGRARITPKLTEYALKWQEHLNKSIMSLQGDNNATKFEKYFEMTNTLLQNDRCSLVATHYANGGKKYYSVKQRVLINGTVEKLISRKFGGLTDRLRTVFYPDTSDNPIEKSKRNKELGGRKPLINPSVGHVHARPCSKTGAEHGTMVHNQFEKITKIMTQSGRFDYYQKQNEDLDPCVESFIDTCIAKKWFPLRSEFIVYDEDLKIATAIDLILVDIVNWKLIVIEFKTGFEYEEYGIHPNDVKFDEPLDDLTNCPLNRHFLQLVTMLIILEKKYDTKIQEGYVVRMCPKAGIIELYESPKWCRLTQYKSIVYDTLLEDARLNIK